MPSRLFIPDELQGPSPVAARNAEFAQTFMPSATGEQRVRYKQDVSEYVGQLQAQQAAHQAEIISRDTKAAQIAKTQAQLEMQQEAHAARMQKVPLEFRLEQARLRAATAKEQLAIQSEVLAQETEAETATAHWELNQALNDPKATPEIRRQWLGELPTKYPKAMRDTGFRQRFSQENKQFQESLEPPKPTAAQIKDSTPDAKIEAIDQSLSTEYGLRLAYFNQPEANVRNVIFDPITKKYVKAGPPTEGEDLSNRHIAVDIARTDKKGNVLTPETRTIPLEKFLELNKRYKDAKAPAASQQQTGSSARPIFKDANGNRAYKNPDGTYEAL